MFNIGFTEMLLIGFLALVLIGPKELPELARTIGRFLNDLKRGTEGFKDEFFNMKDQADYRKHIQADPEEENKTGTTAQNQPQNNVTNSIDPNSVIANTSSVEQTTKATKAENNDGANG